MGWAGGSILMNEIIDVVLANVPDPEVRKRIYGPIFHAFCDDDWDTIGESIRRDDAFDAVVREREPDWFDDGEIDDVSGGESRPKSRDGIG